MSFKNILQRIKIFGQETTIHGVFILAKYRLHLLERIFWLTVITLAAGCAIALCLSNWRRYSANPTVVSIQKDFRNWNNPFPAATGCFYYKADEVETDVYIEETWGVNYSHPKYDYYVEFIKAVANVSYKSLDVFQRFQNDSSLYNIDLMDLSQKVHPELTGTLVTFDTKRKTDWQLIMTEMGICFTVNSKFAEIIALKSNDDDDVIEADEVVVFDKTILKCHYLNGLCYARYDSDPDSPVKFYIHSYLDILHATIETPWYVGESQELEINYRMQETVSDPSLRSLKPTQRRCRFEDEPTTSDVPYFSTSICYMLCRYKLILKYCGCRPFFYINLEGRVCDIKEMLCVAKHADTLMKPPSKLGCDCPQPCNIVTYLAQIPKITFWEYGYFDQRITFRWGLLPPTTKYHRDILFGFEDLVASFGGTVALCLGISFFSVFEIIFFIIENVLYFCCSINLNKYGKSKTVQSAEHKCSKVSQENIKHIKVKTQDKHKHLQKVN